MKPYGLFLFHEDTKMLKPEARGVQEGCKGEARGTQGRSKGNGYVALAVRELFLTPELRLSNLNCEFLPFWV